ncbi:MAG: Delta3-Delta2-enoyl-CoA isomerase [Solirubrobacteraceae bacterium]|jgi:enoyl-CoA hydratase/carnithine racemase|nr:Delta3-Delta2-enoyl-CoA isomerase [Solirubrobacteraceae bacterium]
MPHLERDGDVFVLDIGDDENRFHPDWLASVSDAIDEVIAAPAPRALVTAATGKFFSNGLDLDWLGQNQDRVQDYVAQVQGLFAKMLAAPVPTVAAIQGHCFAAGAMLALAHDRRVMRADRGYFCLPEADINIPFTPGMTKLIQSKLTPATATNAMVGAARFGGEEALAAGIVDAAVAEDAVRPEAVALAAAQAGKDGVTLGTIKSRMYADALEALADRDIRFGA